MALWALRPYQSAAVETLLGLARKKQFLLLQAATGAGKTLMAAAIMSHYARRWSFRCLFLAHKAVLVRQALSRMQTTFADADVDVDCLCASVEKPGQAGGLIIVASPQTLARRLDDLPKVDVVIIDECHRVPPRGQPSLYADIIRAVCERRPNARILGVTATPWRLGQGPIYGQATGTSKDPWWDDLDVRLSMRGLQREGWLCPLTARACRMEEDLADVPVGASGDYREDALENTLLKPLHLGSAVKAVQTEARDRSRIAAFCVTIAHARALAARFASEGISACAVDSRTGASANRQALEDFAAGRLRVLCTVGMLTEGWDCPQTDCLLMCRPTLSPALYVQMVGRGLRTAEGKKDCLLLDLAGNILRHGSPNAPRQGGASSAGHEERLPGGGQSGEGPRFCPFCDAILPAETTLSCPECRADFFELTEQGKTFHEIDLDRLEKATAHGEAVWRRREEVEAQARAEEKARAEAAREALERRRDELINRGAPVRARVLSCSTPLAHQVRSGPASGASVLKVDVTVALSTGQRRTVTIMLDPEGSMGRRNRTCFWALQDTKQFWLVCGQGTFPAGRAAMAMRWHQVRLPEEVWIKQTMGGFLRLLWKEPKARGSKASARIAAGKGETRAGAAPPDRSRTRTTAAPPDKG